MTSPLAMKEKIPWHKSEMDRAKAAKMTKDFFESKFMGDGKCNMWMDTMDDNLEALYEARPWRQYVIDTTTNKVVAKIGLAPFNMDGKIAVIKKACATGASSRLRRQTARGAETRKGVHIVGE